MTLNSHSFLAEIISYIASHHDEMILTIRTLSYLLKFVDLLNFLKSLNVIISFTRFYSNIFQNGQAPFKKTIASIEPLSKI